MLVMCTDSPRVAPVNSHCRVLLSGHHKNIELVNVKNNYARCQQTPSPAQTSLLCRSRSATTNKKYKPDTTSQQEFINTDLSLSISIHPTTNEIITHPTVGSTTSERKWHYKI
ncbi:hypothetical protein DERF_002689 [Dermatophagoides farinae]|uniref:Uncharacterized protein n=1 Tax=Dermatophagoides farinae TaxID=6954 RepID=A0A922LDD7_DERFA|nr:hypothetical protein DERF_002689 [Dermatophagoides farinae]